MQIGQQLQPQAGFMVQANVQAAGGQLIVSPHFNPAFAREAVRLGMVCLPGVMTASETFAVIDAGATGLKFSRLKRSPTLR